MKKITFLFICISFIFMSCSSRTKDNTPQPKVPTVKIKLSLINDGVITDAGLLKSGSSLYDNFHNECLSTGMLIPKNYSSLVFTDIYDENIKYIFNNKSFKDEIELPIGEYYISGKSEPNSYITKDGDASYYYNYISDTCSFAFNENSNYIKITNETTNIALKPSYTCALVLANTSIIRDIVVGNKSNVFSDNPATFSTRIHMKVINSKYIPIFISNINGSKNSTVFYFYRTDMTTPEYRFDFNKSISMGAFEIGKVYEVGITGIKNTIKIDIPKFN